MKRKKILVVALILAASTAAYGDSYRLLTEMSGKNSNLARQGFTDLRAKAARGSLRSRIVLVDANAIVNAASGGKGINPNQATIKPIAPGILNFNFFDDIDFEIDSIGPSVVENLDPYSAIKWYDIRSSSLAVIPRRRESVTIAVAPNGLTLYDAILNNGKVYKIFPLTPIESKSLGRKVPHLVLEVDPNLPKAIEAFGFVEHEWSEEGKQKMRDAIAEREANPQKFYKEYRKAMEKQNINDEKKSRLLAKERRRLGLDQIDLEETND